MLKNNILNICGSKTPVKKVILVLHSQVKVTDLFFSNVFLLNLFKFSWNQVGLQVKHNTAGEGVIR